MQWLKNIIMLIPLILEMVNEHKSKKEKNDERVNEFDEKYRSIRYAPIKTFDDNDPDYIRAIAKISQDERMRYFLFDWKEEAIQACNVNPNHIESIAMMNCLTRLQIRLRDCEMKAIKMEAGNV